MLREVFPTFRADDIRRELVSKGYKIEEVQKNRKYPKKMGKYFTKLCVKYSLCYLLQFRKHLKNT